MIARPWRSNPVAWSLLAATYSALDRETDATNCNFEARRLQAEVAAEGGAGGEGEETFVSTALLLLDLHMPVRAGSVFACHVIHLVFSRSYPASEGIL